MHPNVFMVMALSILTVFLLGGVRCEVHYSSSSTGAIGDSSLMIDSPDD